jgi:hypothetical protein
MLRAAFLEGGLVMKHVWGWGSAAALVALAGCGGSGDGGEGGAAARGTGAADPGGTTGTFTGSGTGAGGPGAGCKRVDLVIAVDNSSSMQEEKQAMRDDVFPAFATALLAVGGGLDDYRVGVLDACPDPASYHTRGAGGECNFASGQPWMESSSPDLVSEFQCVGDIYSGDANCSGSNDDEQPASAAAASMEAPYATGANAGFLRDDALLVVIAITDEDEQPTPAQSAAEVYDRLIAAKGGDVKRMVFLGIGGSQSCNGTYGSANQAQRLREVTDLFIAQGRGVFWDLCQGQLQDGLTEAMAVIEQACGEFPPPE